MFGSYKRYDDFCIHISMHIDHNRFSCNHKPVMSIYKILQNSHFVEGQMKLTEELLPGTQGQCDIWVIHWTFPRYHQIPIYQSPWNIGWTAVRAACLLPGSRFLAKQANHWPEAFSHHMNMFLHFINCLVIIFTVTVCTMKAEQEAPSMVWSIHPNRPAATMCPLPLPGSTGTQPFATIQTQWSFLQCLFG